jgi:hypothetical protein
MDNSFIPALSVEKHQKEEIRKMKSYPQIRLSVCLSLFIQLALFFLIEKKYIRKTTLHQVLPKDKKKYGWGSERGMTLHRKSNLITSSKYQSLRRKSPLKTRPKVKKFFDEVNLPMAFEKITSSKVQFIA